LTAYMCLLIFFFNLSVKKSSINFY
jgi:hypothetical protein